MIEGKAKPPKPAFIRSLENKAASLAKAHGEMRVRAKNKDASRWRTPALLWPLFAKGR